MSAYVNAVTDTLIVSSFPEQIVYLIYGKDQKLKWVKSLSASKLTLPNEVAEGIFSQTSHIVSCSNCTLVPLSEDNVEAYFQLNYQNYDQLLTRTYDSIQVVYDVSSDLISLENSLVGPSNSPDMTLVFDYIRKSKETNVLFIYKVEEILTIVVWSNDTLVLANRYSVKNPDEVFYYVMLVVEQVEISVSDLQFKCIGSLEFWQTYKNLFQNYLPELRRVEVQESLDADMNIATNDITIANFFAQCVL